MVLFKNNKLLINLDFNDSCQLNLTSLTDEDLDIKVYYGKEGDELLEYSIELLGRDSTRFNGHEVYFRDWHIEVHINDEMVFFHDINLEDQDVRIVMVSKNLGDSTTWIPYVEEFRQKHKCNIYLVTVNKELFEAEYPFITFLDEFNNSIDYHATYWLGGFDILEKNKNLGKHHPTPTYLGDMQKIASDILGLDFKEKKAKLTVYKDFKLPSKKPYVTIAPFATARAKMWNYKGNDGWQELVDYLKNKGYDVVNCSMEEDGERYFKIPKGVISKPKDTSIEERVFDIKHSEFFIGGSSGLYWVAHSLGIWSILITGHTHEFFDGKSKTIRVSLEKDEDVCTGCWHNEEIDWNFDNYFCPLHQEDESGVPNLDPTSRKWECTKKITTDMVIDAVKEVESKKGKIEKVKENYISLGVNIGHDASTALCINGELISNIAEERLTRSKHDKAEDGVPMQSIRYVLNSNSIDLPQVNVVVYNGPGEGHGVDYVLQCQQKFHKIGIRDSKLTYGLHHLMHAYSAYYSFPGKKGTAIVVDAGGEIAYHWSVSRQGQKYNVDNTIAENASIYKIEKNTFETVYKHYHNYFPTRESFLKGLTHNVVDYRGHSLGAFYEMACGVVGLGPGGFAAGKLMGMASYGKEENLYDEIGKPLHRNFIDIDESLHGDFYVPRDRINDNLMHWYNYDLREDDFQTQADFALHIQLQFERAILFLIKKANLIAPNENLYLAGGSFLNSTVNQKIVDSGLFENVHIIPSADDTGISIGCAYYGYWKNFRE